MTEQRYARHATEQCYAKHVTQSFACQHVRVQDRDPPRR